MHFICRLRCSQSLNLGSLTAANCCCCCAVTAAVLCWHCCSPCAGTAAAVLHRCWWPGCDCCCAGTAVRHRPGRQPYDFAPLVAGVGLGVPPIGDPFPHRLAHVCGGLARLQQLQLLLSLLDTEGPSSAPLTDCQRTASSIIAGACDAGCPDIVPESLRLRDYGGQRGLDWP